MSAEAWSSYLADQRKATRAAAELLPTVVRFSFNGGPLHGLYNVAELTAQNDGKIVEANFKGHLYRSATPWRKRASAIVLVHVASAWPRSR